VFVGKRAQFLPVPVAHDTGAGEGGPGQPVGQHGSHLIDRPQMLGRAKPGL
jgi:hypothetical protein